KSLRSGTSGTWRGAGLSSLAGMAVSSASVIGLSRTLGANGPSTTRLPCRIPAERRTTPAAGGLGPPARPEPPAFRARRRPPLPPPPTPPGSGAAPPPRRPLLGHRADRLPRDPRDAQSFVSGRHGRVGKAPAVPAPPLGAVGDGAQLLVGEAAMDDELADPG